MKKKNVSQYLSEVNIQHISLNMKAARYNCVKIKRPTPETSQLTSYPVQTYETKRI
jgi:hypothetical protein